MKSYIEQNLLVLVCETLADVYTYLAKECPTPLKSKDFDRDSAYIAKRYNAEGLPFFTTTLPRLGAWFDLRMRRLQVNERVEGFAPYDGLNPCFLRPLWIYLEQLDFANVSDTHYELVRCVRTLLHGFKKLDVPCKEELIDAKLENFLKIEEDLTLQSIYPSPVGRRAQLLADRIFFGQTVEILRPRHGPGAVSGGERLNGKWKFSTIHESVHRVWPYWDYLFPVRSAIAEPGLPRRSRCLQLAAGAKQYRSMTRLPFPTSRLLLVPKDSRGPRVITCEPKELMYLQQGASDWLVNLLANHQYTHGHVNFDDQEINANIALASSKTHEFATIDLSDASDRVSCKLVSFLFPHGISEKLLALRSTATKLPDGSVVELRKFAAMGSALCFPVESLVFWLITVASVWQQTCDLHRALDSVFVYGDDIVVKTEFAIQAIEDLESFDLKVNRQKSFIGNDPFRESCGIDALDGHNVTPFRIKKLPPQRPSDGDGIVAWVKYCENSQYICPRRSRCCIRLVEALVGPIPRVPFAQPFISIVSNELNWGLSAYGKTRWSPSDCYHRARLLVVKNRKFDDPIEPWARLQRNLIERLVDSDSPSIVVDRRSTQIRRKWANITYV